MSRRFVRPAMAASVLTVWTASAPSAGAQPPLDLGEFEAVDASAYFQPQRGGPSYQFVTTDGVRCEITLGGIRCAAGASSSPGGACLEVGPTNNGRVTPPHTYAFTEDECAVRGGEPKVLDAGRKLIAQLSPVGTFTCAAAPGSRLVCVDDRENHGFAMEPNGHSTF